MRTPLLLAAALLCSLPTRAEVYRTQDDFHFSLERGAPTSATDGDLHISAIGVYAAHGAKRVSRPGGFQTREVVVLGEPYLLRDASGETWRMSIRMSTNRDIEVELTRDRQRPEARASDVFTAVSVRIDGAEATPTFAELELASDGTYRLGTARGRFERDQARVELDGVPSQWGPGIFSLDGGGLTFRYQRGRVKWEVKYARKPPGAAPNPPLAQLAPSQP